MKIEDEEQLQKHFYRNYEKGYEVKGGLRRVYLEVQEPMTTS